MGAKSVLVLFVNKYVMDKILTLIIPTLLSGFASGGRGRGCVGGARRE